MFTSTTTPQNVNSEPNTSTPRVNIASENAKYKNVMTNSDATESTYFAIDNILENEKMTNKNGSWNKLDKTVKTQKLHIFSEKYGKEHNIPMKEIKNLKLFFSESLDKNKLQKTKDVIYDKEKGCISSIPALTFNQTNRSFTLKNLDLKHVSTIKSLTPKRTSEMSNENAKMV